MTQVTAGWLPRTGISSGTLRSVIKHGVLLPFYSNLSTTVSEILQSAGLQTSSVAIRNTSCWMASSLPRHLSHLAFLKAQSSAPSYFLFTSMISRVQFVPQFGCLLMTACCTIPSKPCMTPTHSNPTLTVSSNGKRTGWRSSILPSVRSSPLLGK